jgi:hypothetical protein
MSRGARVCRLWVPLPPRAGFCELPSSFHLMQPGYPLLQAERRSGCISAAFLPAPAGGPRRGVCEAWPRHPAPLEAGGGATRGTAAAPGPTLTLKWEKSVEVSLAQADMHPSEHPLRGSSSCTSLGKRSTQGGVWVRVDFPRRDAFRVRWGK